MKKFILLFLSIFALSQTIKAQEGFEEVIVAGTADSEKILEGYFAPAMEGFIYGMNNGWYHTAKVHKTFGFDLSVGLSASIVPSEKEMFSLAGLSSISGASSAPTFAGPDNSTNLTVTRTITINNTNSPANGQSQQVTAPLTLPGGVTGDLPLNAVPAPIAQLNVGLPFKMDAMVRFMPETSLGDDGGQIKMLGLGVKKEITNWFGPMDKTPLHISLLAAYTTMDVSYGIEDSGDLTATNALAEFNLTAFTAQAIASLNLPFINIYGGFGYSSGKSNLKMTGSYSGEYSYNIGGTNYTETVDINAPDLNFSASGFKTTVGARLSLGFLKIFADYTLQEYNTVSAGVAISIR